jgi:hypothetical protein
MKPEAVVTRTWTPVRAWGSSTIEADTDSHRPFRVSVSARNYLNRKDGVGPVENRGGTVTCSQRYRAP